MDFASVVGSAGKRIRLAIWGSTVGEELELRGGILAIREWKSGTRKEIIRILLFFLANCVFAAGFAGYGWCGFTSY